MQKMTSLLDDKLVHLFALSAFIWFVLYFGCAISKDLRHKQASPEMSNVKNKACPSLGHGHFRSSNNERNTAYQPAIAPFSNPIEQSIHLPHS